MTQRIRFGSVPIVRREQLVPINPPAEHELDRLAGRHPVELVDQLQRQALELGQRLQSQQTDLDRREAEFHARVARMENELRTARLLQIERQHELEQQAEQLAGTAALDVTIVEQIHRVDIAQSVLTPLASDEAPQPGDQNAPIPSKVLDHLNDRQAASRWEQRLLEIEKSERALQAQLGQLEYDRRKLDEDRAALIEHQQTREAADAKLLGEHKRKFELELKRLQQWANDLDRRSHAVEQLHQDASRMYREALEIRLGTEQMWSELRGTVSETELTQRLAALRRQLMDHFNLIYERIEDKQSEVDSLLERLETHQGSLRSQRNELRRWIARRHAEIESDAAKLLERERQLEQREDELDTLKSNWRQERHEYEQKLRRLSRLVNAA